ncbi:carbonic anhydrase 1-like [Argopecten irradians]|uniref:carbonic anhydrase 1-like n=1 Tax=Argopecten irradians TaxID=31199 RepID=UPI00370FA453
MTSILLYIAVLFLGTVGSYHISRKSGFDQWEQCQDIDGFFSYNPGSECGPAKWHEKYPSCKSNKQSPIDINKHHLKCSDYSRIFYRHSDKVDGVFENNGRTANFAVNENSLNNILVLKGHDQEDGEHCGYVFKELHFHIGRKGSSYGSEHTINGKGYKGEIHLVHEKLDGCTNENEDGDDQHEDENEKEEIEHGDHKGTLLAIGVFFNVVERCGSYADKLISKYVTKIPNYRDKTAAHVKPSKMLPDDGKFYTYIGSKTTPVCVPDVLWFVFKNATTICKKNYKVLKRLQTWEAGNPPLSKFGNNRPIQRFNVNDVRKNYGNRCRKENE